MDPSLSFHNHCTYVSDGIDKINTLLKALAGSSWGQDFTADLQHIGESIASYAAPVWSTNTSDSSFKNVHTAQNAALRTATGAHKMVIIDHLHQEYRTLKVKDHSYMLSAQYLVNCLKEEHVYHGITTQVPRPRPMKEALYSRYHSTVLYRLGTSRKESHQKLHIRGRFYYSATRNQQSTKGASSHNIGREAETEPKTTMYFLTITVRTLPSIAALQTWGVRRTKQHLYRLWSFTT